MALKAAALPLSYAPELRLNILHENNLAHSGSVGRMDESNAQRASVRGFVFRRDSAAAFPLPEVIFAQFLLVLFHLRFNFGERDFRASQNVGPRSRSVA